MGQSASMRKAGIACDSPSIHVLQALISRKSCRHLTLASNWKAIFSMNWPRRMTRLTKPATSSNVTATASTSIPSRRNPASPNAPEDNTTTTNRHNCSQSQIKGRKYGLFISMDVSAVGNTCPVSFADNYWKHWMHSACPDPRHN